MNKKNAMRKILKLIPVAYKYLSAHADSLTAMKGTFMRQYKEDGSNFKYSIVIQFAPIGSLYQITESMYVNHLIVNQKTYLATYGWQSTGHLIEIGEDRCWIFDHLGNRLYVEYTTGGITIKTELFDRVLLNQPM